MTKLPMLLDWKALKNLLGHPYSRQHTYRLMDQDDLPFPRPVKLGRASEPGELDRSRAVWRSTEVLNWYKAKGLPLDLDIEAP
jgi:predicted DNA-binding transcriptional regulator AlpA